MNTPLLKSRLWTSKPKSDYQKIIAEYAREDWRFVQIFAHETAEYGNTSYFELIFEQ